MITKKELQDIVRLKGLTLGNAEKDYLIDMALLSISSNTKNELVFKGGTCLYKFHKLNRFSEDLDFSAINKIDINKLIGNIIRDFERFGVKAKLQQKKELFNSVLTTLRAEGPLFTGKPITYASLGIDINLKSSVLLEPGVLSYEPIYREIPTVSVLCMKKEEIFAEKIRALMTRQRARDLFDLDFLLKNNSFEDLDIINKKMEYYNEKFNFDKLSMNIGMLEKSWKKELTGFAPNLPEFDVVKKAVIKSLLRIYKKPS